MLPHGVDRFRRPGLAKWSQWELMRFGIHGTPGPTWRTRPRFVRLVFCDHDNVQKGTSTCGRIGLDIVYHPAENLETSAAPKGFAGTSKRFARRTPLDMGNSAPEPAQPSALHGSIENKKDISYYYAHAPRDQTGEAPAPMPVHRPIATTAYVPGEKVKEMKSFQFLDDGKFAKVYLPLDGLEKIADDNITADFQTRSLCVTIRGLEQLPLQFRIARLNNDITPIECVVKILKTKVLIKLKKAVVIEKQSSDAGDIETDAIDGEAPELAKEPAEDAEQDDASVPAVNAASADVDAEAGTAENKVTEHYPHWYQLRE